MKDENKEIITGWNSSRASLERLNTLLIESNESSKQSYLADNAEERIHQLKKWKLNTKAIYREISPKLTSDEQKKINDLIKKYSKIKPVMTNKKTSKGYIKTFHNQQFQKQWAITHQLELKLRKLADDKGMLIINKDLENLGSMVNFNR